MVQPFQKVWDLLSLANPFPACAIVTGLSEGFGSWKASVLWQRSAGIGITLFLVETWRLKHELKHTTWYLVVPSATFNSCIAGDVLLQQRCQVFSSSQQAMLPSGPHSGWQHIFLGCEDSTFMVASRGLYEVSQRWIAKPWDYVVHLPPCGYLVTLCHITLDHHPCSNLTLLHWLSHLSKKTTPSCLVDLLISTPKTDWLKISPTCFFLVPLGPWLIGLTDAERHAILI